MKRLTLILCFLLFSVPVYADSCANGPLSTIIGTSCSIGDKIFDFTGYVPYAYSGEPLDTNLIEFSSDASDPFMLTFTLSSSVFNAVSPDRDHSQSYAGELYFLVHTPPGALFIADYEVIMTGAAVHATPDGRTDPPSTGFAEAILQLSGVTKQAFDEFALSDRWEIAHQTARNVSAEVQRGTAMWELVAMGAQSSASMQSATYRFGQSVTPVPEPSTAAFVLLGLGAVSFLFRHR